MRKRGSQGEVGWRERDRKEEKRNNGQGGIKEECV